MTDLNIPHVLKTVLNDNRGQVLTEALCLGIEQCVLFYLNSLKQAEQRDLARMEEGVNHGL